MSRVVIEISTHNEFEEKTVSLRVEEPPELADLGSSTLDLAIDAPAFAALESLNGPAPVTGAGKLLYDHITRNAAVGQALDKIAAVSPGDALELRLRVSPGNPADEFPWEALYLPQKNKFVGLDPRWPMARMAGHAGGEEQFVPVSGPIKITAVLAALDREALPEWNAIYDAATGSGLDFQILLLCSEPELKAQVEAANDPRVVVEPVPGDADSLVQRIGRTQPHILHIFSHARAEGGFLEIASPEAVGLGNPEAVVYVDSELLAQASVRTWITVLNACEGAEPTAGGRSFAYAITMDGTPAAIGMRREIDATDAHEFARVFYEEALDHISEQMTDGQPRELRWAEVVRMARNRMLPHGPKSEVASQTLEWTLPVLYLSPGRYLLWKTTPAAALSPEEARVVTAELRQLEGTVIPDDADEAFRTLVENKIAELRVKLGG